MQEKEKQRIRAVLFRESRGSRCDFGMLSRRTGIPEATLRRYKREPEAIPLNRLLLIAKAMDIDKAEAGTLLIGG